MPKPKPGCTDAQLRNVDKEQWIKFMHIAKLEGKSATQKIKEFIQDIVNPECETDGCRQLAEFYDPMDNKLCSDCIQQAVETSEYSWDDCESLP